MNYNKIRRISKEIKIGNTAIGGSNKIAIQSMTNTDTHDVSATLEQIRRLEEAGCNIVRIAVPDIDAAKTVLELKKLGVSIPIVADIHFDYKIALKCAEYGVDKIRINPGNIGSDERVRAVCEACSERGIPIRIGVNSGSLEKEILKKYGAPTPEALCESAMYHISLLERYGFDNIVVAAKMSTVYNTVAVNRMIAEKCNYPIHIGVTEAGGNYMGTVKSAAAFGALLCGGIGDTLRVSLTDDPVNEIIAAKCILNSLEMEGQRGLSVVSCPTCGRTNVDLISLVRSFEDAVDKEGLRDLPLKVALMGCVVNGPGEAMCADIGVAGGKGEAVLFKKGKTVGKIPEDKIIEVLISELKKLKG